MKKPFTVGPEGIQMLNEKGDRVFFIECINGMPLMDLNVNGCSLTILPQPGGFSIEYVREPLQNR